MRKIVLAICACALLLCGCGAQNEKGSGLELEKAQEIEVISADGELVKILSGGDELDEFDSALDAEEWEPVRLPENVTLRGEFVLRQTETLKLGQSPENLGMEELGRLRLYNSPYASLTILGFELSVELSDHAWEYLNAYFE